MTTLFDIMLQVATILQPGDEGTATGGSSTTLVDTNNPRAAKYYTSGTLYIRSGNNVGKALVIASWLSKIFTLPGQAQTFAAGDTYTAQPPKFPRDLIHQAIWSAMNDLGKYGATDETLTTVVDQEEYTLPAGVTDVRRVQITHNTAAPWEWGKPWVGWEERGTKLVFRNRPQLAAHKIRLYYAKAHAVLAADADVVDPTYNPERLIWKAVWYAAIGARKPNAKDDPRLIETINLAANMVQKYDATYPVAILARDPRFASW